MSNKYVQVAIAIAAVTGLMATNVVVGVVRSERDRQKVATMTETMKTVCVGRFLIDLPEHTKYSFQGAFLQGFDIRVFPETTEVFKVRVAERERELRNPTPDYYGGVKSLEVARDVQISDFAGKMFVFGRETTEGLVAQRRVEVISVQIEVHAHANGFSVDISNSQAYPDRLDLPLSLLAQLSLNPENKIPNEPGFCIDHAYFREPLTAAQGERVTMLAGLPAHPDITIMFDTIAGTAPEKEGLLARTKKADAKASADEKARTRKLGDGVRTINGIPGEQSLEGYREFNSTTGYAFMWDSPGTADDVFRPALSFELQSGVNRRAGGQSVQSSLSEKALMDLWNKITASIRLRATESPKVSASEPPVPSLGTIASAGEACPQSGWWLCGDGRNGIGVQGGQRQYIKQGERMPQALLLPPQTMWEKVRGLQSSYVEKTPTYWKLVDKRSRKRSTPTVQLAQATVARTVATTAAAASGLASKPSVGTYATTGRPCPASGWWRCEESHALDGTRWFAQGCLLPAATFAVPPDVVGRSAGTLKAIQRHVTWRLVRSVDAPEQVSGDPS